ncbi:MAG: hypothetical protein ABIZ72_09760 [Candidatus Limnocylindrales bacterium]
MTTPANPPGDRRPALDRPPSDRYVGRIPDGPSAAGSRHAGTRLVPVGLVLGTAIAFIVLGGILAVTAGLVIVAAFAGWLTGRLVSPPAHAALIALAAVALGLLGIWLFGRTEGGVLDPITYLLEVEGPIVVALGLVAAGGLAAAAAR